MTLDFVNGTASGALGVVPVKEHWSKTLDATDTAILGAIYTPKHLKSLNVEPGLYAVQAKRVNHIVHWLLLRPDGSPATDPVQICIEKLKEPVTNPRALLISKSPERCCYQDDSIMQCGECD